MLLIKTVVTSQMCIHPLIHTKVEHTQVVWTFVMTLCQQKTVALWKALVSLPLRMLMMSIWKHWLFISFSNESD